jgi:hypothetical protein
MPQNRPRLLLSTLLSIQALQPSIYSTLCNTALKKASYPGTGQDGSSGNAADLISTGKPTILTVFRGFPQSLQDDTLRLGYGCLPHMLSNPLFSVIHISDAMMSALLTSAFMVSRSWALWIYGLVNDTDSSSEYRVE